MRSFSFKIGGLGKAWRVQSARVGGEWGLNVNWSVVTILYRSLPREDLYQWPQSRELSIPLPANESFSLPQIQIKFHRIHYGMPFKIYEGHKIYHLFYHMNWLCPFFTIWDSNLTMCFWLLSYHQIYWSSLSFSILSPHGLFRSFITWL